MFDIIIFATIAVLIFFKLFSEFGKKSESDRVRERIVNSFPKPFNRKKKSKIIDVTGTVRERKENETLFDIKKLKLSKDLEEKILGSEILKIINFVDFIERAEEGMDLAVDAFSRKDKKVLSLLLAKSIFSKFQKEIDAFKKKKQTIKSSIVSVLDKKIVDVSHNSKFVYIDVKFKTEQINFLMDENKKLIEGDKNKIEVVEEIWTFRREAKPKYPGWQITGILSVD